MKTRTRKRRRGAELRMPRDHAAVPDVLSERWIMVKAVLFLLMAILSSSLLILPDPRIGTALLLGLALWSTARFYYFAFYVIENYVDREFRFSGLFDFAVYMVGRHRLSGS